jgi:peptidoglycan/LPS O-acetylase OafA/YrhL
MTGVEILTTETIYNNIIPEEWIALAVLLLVFGVLFVIFAVVEGCNKLAGLSSMFALVGVLLMLLACISDKTDIAYVEHKVTISDEVSMNEFNEKYEIIEQD